jgi:hypothetical protein
MKDHASRSAQKAASTFPALPPRVAARILDVLVPMKGQPGGRTIRLGSPDEVGARRSQGAEGGSEPIAS